MRREAASWSTWSTCRSTPRRIWPRPGARGRFRVSGPRVERWVAEVDMDDPRQVADLQRRLVRAGVERRLSEAGARRGDEVVIGDTTFSFIPEDDASDSSEAGGKP